MSTQTRERNYTKRPHTARFLQTFHSAISSTGRNYRDDAAALATEAGQDDLLDLVPVDATFTQSPAQVSYISDLVLKVNAMDAKLGEEAASYTGRMDREGAWTPENTSRWIDNLKAKVAELRTAAPAPSKGTATTIPAGRYAVETDEIRCYSVEYGKEGTRWAGYTFLNRISSDDRFPIKNPAEKARILDAIRADVAAAELLAALTLRICRGTMTNGRPCGRTLSDTKNPYFSQGYGPECGKNL